MGVRPHGPVRWQMVATRDGGVRKLVRLSRGDDVRFRRLVARVAPAAERLLSPSVLANRLASTTGPTTTGPGTAGPPLLAPWRPARRAWAHALRLATSDHLTIVAADVADCYPSIGPTSVARALDRAGVDPVHVAPLVAWLRGLEDHGVRGLPVGPEASAVLANAVLAAGDQALTDAGVRWLRWVDDWAIVSGDLRRAGRALSALGAALEHEGLRLHPRKTGRVLGADHFDVSVVSGPDAGNATRHPGGSPGVVA